MGWLSRRHDPAVMAESKAFQKASYPLPVYNFRVTVDGLAMSFSEVSGIHREHERLTYRHGLSFWEGESIRTFRYDKYVSVTLKKGTVRGANLLYGWMQETGTRTRSVEVSLCDEEGQPVVVWHIAKAVPVKLEAPTFDPNTNDVAIESLELMAAGISVTHF